MIFFNRKILKTVITLFLVCLVSCNKPDLPDTGQSVLDFWTVGNYIPQRFGTDLWPALDKIKGNNNQLDKFLLTIAEQSLSINQIKERSDLTLSQIEYFITSLDSIHLLKKDNRERWSPVIPVITDERMRIIRQDIYQMAYETAQYLMSEIPEMKSLYDSLKLPADPSWESISHLLIDKLIIDATFHIHLNGLYYERKSELYGDSYESKSSAFFLERGKHLATFGCNWYVFRQKGEQREVYVLHGALLDRYNISMNKYRGDKQFGSLIFNISEGGGIDSLSGEDLAVLKDLSWISNDSLKVPVVKAGTVKQLMPMMDTLGEIAAGVAFKYFDDITDSYNKSPQSKFQEYDGDYIQICIHTLFSMIIEKLEQNSALPPIPHPAPDYFGVYFVEGKLF